MEDDFSAPKLRDFDPPRVFATVTSKAVSYNMDFVEYLMGQETARRFASGMPKMTLDQESDFRRELIAKVISPTAYLNQPETVVNQVLTGKFADGLGGIRNVPDANTATHSGNGSRSNSTS